MTEQTDGIDAFKSESKRLDHYFQHNFDRVSQEIAGRIRVDWAAIIGAAAQKHITGRRGGKLSSQLCRRTWKSVVDRKKHRASDITAIAPVAALNSPTRADETEIKSATVDRRPAAPQDLSARFQMAEDRRRASTSDRLFTNREK